MHFISDAKTETNKKRLEYMHYDFTNDLPVNVINDINSLVGFNVIHYKITIKGEGISHIENMHGQNGKHDHSKQEDYDVARMQYIISNADKAAYTVNSSNEIVKDHQYRNSDNTESNVISITKKINGTYYIVCAVPDSQKQTMFIKSAYISKKEANQEFDVTNTPNITSKTNLDITSNRIVTNYPQIVNSSSHISSKISSNEGRSSLSSPNASTPSFVDPARRSATLQSSGYKPTFGESFKDGSVAFRQKHLHILLNVDVVP